MQQNSKFIFKAFKHKNHAFSGISKQTFFSFFCVKIVLFLRHHFFTKYLWNSKDIGTSHNQDAWFYYRSSNNFFSSLSWWMVSRKEWQMRKKSSQYIIILLFCGHFVVYKILLLYIGGIFFQWTCRHAFYQFIVPMNHLMLLGG